VLGRCLKHAVSSRTKGSGGFEVIWLLSLYSNIRFEYPGSCMEIYVDFERSPPRKVKDPGLWRLDVRAARFAVCGVESNSSNDFGQDLSTCAMWMQGPRAQCTGSLGQNWTLLAFRLFVRAAYGNCYCMVRVGNVEGSRCRLCRRHVRHELEIKSGNI
jgi:hypothetical protein